MLKKALSLGFDVNRMRGELKLRSKGNVLC